MSALHLMVCIAGERVAVPADRVEAVVDLTDIVPVPFAPAHVAGLAAVRSQVVAVIDDTGAPVGERASRALLVEHRGHRYALIVDAVEDVREVGQVEPVDTRTLAHRWQAAALGIVAVGDGHALLIDPVALIEPSDVNAAVALAA